MGWPYKAALGPLNQKRIKEVRGKVSAEGKKATHVVPANGEQPLR